MSSYVSNNIRFRIISAHAISQFKADQAFDFNELVNNPVYKFSNKNREILLLAYDKFFNFITRLEKMFVRHNTQTNINKNVLKEAVSAYDECLIDIESTMRDHMSFFDETSTQIIKLTYKRFTNFTRDIILSMINNSILIAFPTILNAISDMLNSLLCQIHEVDFLLNNTSENKIAFLSFSQACYDMSVLGIDILLERVTIYKKYFPNQKQYTIKNYTSHVINVDNIVSNGVEIVKVDQLKNFLYLTV